MTHSRSEAIKKLDFDLMELDSHVEELRRFAFQETLLCLEEEFRREFQFDLKADLLGLDSDQKDLMVQALRRLESSEDSQDSGPSGTREVWL